MDSCQEGLFNGLDMPADEKYEKLLKAHDKKCGRIDPERIDKIQMDTDNISDLMVDGI